MPHHFVSAVVLCSVVCLRVARVLAKIACRPQRNRGVWQRLDYQECAKSLPGLGASLVVFGVARA